MQEIYYTHQVKKEIDKDKRLPKEIYQAIVNRLKIISQDKLTDTEAHSAARNLIGFYQEIVDYKLKKRNHAG